MHVHLQGLKGTTWDKYIQCPPSDVNQTGKPGSLPPLIGIAPELHSLGLSLHSNQAAVVDANQLRPCSAKELV